MSNEPTPALTPVPVHVVGVAADVTMGQAPAAAAPEECTYRSVFRTVVLTADEPQQDVLPASGDRLYADIQPLDNDIVIGPDNATVANKNNLVTNVPNPSGTYVPKSNTVPYRVLHNDPVYIGATTMATISRVSVTAVYKK